MMNGRLLPEGIDWSQGALWAFTNDPFLLHFLHRWWAWVAFGALLWLARAAKRAGERRASFALHAALGTQILLGIVTVESGMNIVAAVAHQGVGALLVAATAWAAHAAGRAAPAPAVAGYPSAKPA
jgi:cytochrome c oxidase assembly protein subunit 15